MHVYDILNNRVINVDKESNKLKTLLSEEELYLNGYYNVQTMFDVFEYLFRKLPLVGNFIRLREFLTKEEFDECNTIEQFSLLCEKVFTLLYQCEYFFHQEYNFRLDIYNAKEEEIKRVLDFDLQKLGLKRKLIDTAYGKVYVIHPNDALLLKAIEAEPHLTECIIEYSRPSNKGNLIEKEKNLHLIIKAVEHIAQDEKFKKNKIAEQAETIFNTFHIRHDNIEGKKPNPIIEKMSNKELEEIWDMGYRLALELLVLNEFDSIDKKVDKLRERIKEEKKTKNKI